MCGAEIVNGLPPARMDRRLISPVDASPRITEELQFDLSAAKKVPKDQVTLDPEAYTFLRPVGHLT